MKRWAGLLLAGVVALAVGAGATAALSSSDDDGVTRPGPAARTALPGLVVPTGEPTLPSLTSLSPKPGRVLQAAGPFDDRFVLERPQFDGAQVTAVVRITSDVSDLLDLQVLAGFYDRSGTLLGTARTEQHSDGEEHAGPPEQSHPVRVPVPPELAGRAASAAVGVTVLVNE